MSFRSQPLSAQAQSNNDSNASRSLQLARLGDSAKMARGDKPATTLIKETEISCVIAYTGSWQGAMPSIPTFYPRQLSPILAPRPRTQYPFSTFSHNEMRLLIPRWSPISFNKETVARAHVPVQHIGHSLPPETQPFREVLPRTSPRIPRLETGTILTLPRYSTGYLTRLLAVIHLLKNSTK